MNAIFIEETIDMMKDCLERMEAIRDENIKPSSERLEYEPLFGQNIHNAIRIAIQKGREANKICYLKFNSITLAVDGCKPEKDYVREYFQQLKNNADKKYALSSLPLENVSGDEIDKWVELYPNKVEIKRSIHLK